MTKLDEAGPNIGALSRVRAAAGDPLLAYMMGCDIDTLDTLITGAPRLSDKQIEVSQTLSSLLETLPPGLESESSDAVIRNLLLRNIGSSGSVAKNLHEHIMGTERPVESQDSLEQSIAELAIDLYPAFLLPPDKQVPFEPFNLMIHAILASHPEAINFRQVVLSDPLLQDVFGDEQPNIGHVTMVTTNLYWSGWVQLSLLPSILLSCAWRSLESQFPSTQMFAAQAIAELALVRRVLSKKSAPVTVRITFAGALLPPGIQLELCDGSMVREVSDFDRRYSLGHRDSGATSHVDAAGETVTINYNGDIVLTRKFPFRARAGHTDDANLDAPLEDSQQHKILDRVASRLRFSLMLATEREHRVQIVEAARVFDQPLSQGKTMSLGDPARSPGLRATQLTVEEVTAWGEWYKHLQGPIVDKIDVALTRILRAASERREPSDLLIDAVIAWENLFGTKEGEPTLRISSSIALLLESEFDARNSLRKRLVDIYKLRSSIVHGSKDLKSADDYAMCYESLDIALRVVRKLILERRDVLGLPDGSARSVKLLLS
jgi:hypothetical protein